MFFINFFFITYASAAAIFFSQNALSSNEFKVTSNGCGQLSGADENNCKTDNFPGYTCQVFCQDKTETLTATCTCDTVRFGAVEIFVQDKCQWKISGTCSAQNIAENIAEDVKYIENNDFKIKLLAETEAKIKVAEADLAKIEEKMFDEEELAQAKLESIKTRFDDVQMTAIINNIQFSAQMKKFNANIDKILNILK